MSLIAFSFYLPLAAMIAPMLVESTSEPATPATPAAAPAASGGLSASIGPKSDAEEEDEKKAKDEKAKQQLAAKKKDVIYVQPFLSMITVSKCMLLVAGR